MKGMQGHGANWRLYAPTALFAPTGGPGLKALLAQFMWQSAEREQP